jgi:hypothetical protein
VGLSALIIGYGALGRHTDGLAGSFGALGSHYSQSDAMIMLSGAVLGVVGVSAWNLRRPDQNQITR